MPRFIPETDDRHDELGQGRNSSSNNSSVKTNYLRSSSVQTNVLG